MKTLTFKTDIAASAKKVWDTMLDPVSYKEWTKVTWPNSFYEGNWKQGENIKFISPGQGGTLATIIENNPYTFILAKHIAVINKDGTEDRNSDVAKGWVGTTEAYTFTEKNGGTNLQVEMTINPEWEKMFANDWPKALAKLKEVCEK
jgi:Activator of Hsp90 ATPase homolog 1-like protein